MAFFDTIFVSITLFIDTEFSVTDHSAKNLLKHIFYVSDSMALWDQRNTDY